VSEHVVAVSVLIIMGGGGEINSVLLVNISFT